MSKVMWENIESKINLSPSYQRSCSQSKAVVRKVPNTKIGNADFPIKQITWFS
jgi:hypothetical protein